MRSLIPNPILRGFNPDPSVIRVGDDFFVATSTFEWFPGVLLHHSRDLRNWRTIGHALTRQSQLDMRGNPDSCGVWAPCLTYDKGTFYLVYSNVRSFDGIWKDTPNFLVTTEDIYGEWSDPVFLNASGFDASLFHAPDGSKWLVNMLVDHRKNSFFGGIVLQELDSTSFKPTGDVHHIFKGTGLGNTEAPHLYFHEGYYYLILAEGGTEYGHAVTVARSHSLTGPYELHPQNPIISTRENPDFPLQKTGHGDFFQLASGEWYIAFLVGRPLSRLGRCTLGRETAIERIIWRDGWPWLEKGGREPRVHIPAPELQAHSFPAAPARDDFNDATLSTSYQTLRIPADESWISLDARPGFLRLFGRESLSSLHEQSLIGRRVQHFHVEVSCSLDFSPTNFQQMAGLVCYYNTAHWHYMYLSTNEQGGQELTILSSDNFQTTQALPLPLPISAEMPLYLKVSFDRAQIQFYYAHQPGDWQIIGPILDGSILSDDYVRDGSDRYRPAFTGSFIGLCCQDLSGQRRPADFDWFEYEEKS